MLVCVIAAVGMVGVTWDGRGGPRTEGSPGHQLTRNLGSQSYNHKKLDYRNNWNEFESRFFPGASRLEPSPTDTVILAL